MFYLPRLDTYSSSLGGEVRRNMVAKVMGSELGDVKYSESGGGGTETKENVQLALQIRYLASGEARRCVCVCVFIPQMHQIFKSGWGFDGFICTQMDGAVCPHDADICRDSQRF